MRKAILILPLFLLMGCNAYQKAQDVSKVLSGVLAIAAAEVPALPAADQPILSGWVTLGNTLEGQLNTCITAAGTGGKSSTFLACFNAFAAGLASPSELAQLKILSAGSQSKVQLYITAAIVGVNTAIDFFGGASVPVPTVGSAPSAQELNAFRERVLLAVN